MLSEVQQRQLDHYMSLSYTILLKQDVEGGGLVCQNR
jgi:hypothetical protein